MSLTEGLSKGLSLPSVSRRGFLEVNAKLAALAGAGSMAVSNAPKVFAMGTVGRPSVEAGPAGQLGEERMYYNSDTLNCMGQRCVHKIYVRMAELRGLKRILRVIPGMLGSVHKCGRA